MALTSDDLTGIAALAGQSGSVRELAAALRGRYAGLRVTVLDPLDVRDETPLKHLPGCDLFLMASDGHCWSMTTDPAQAVGIVLTPRSTP